MKVDLKNENENVTIKDLEILVSPIHTSLIKKKEDMWMMKEGSMMKHISLHSTLLKMP